MFYYSLKEKMNVSDILIDSSETIDDGIGKEIEVDDLLHDIRNKLTIIKGHSFKLSRKYVDEEFTPIVININRINELINEFYLRANKEKKPLIGNYEIKDFIIQLSAMIEVLSLQFSITIKSFIFQDTQLQNEYIKLCPKLLRNIIENAIDNSIKAQSSEINIYLIRENINYTVDIIDNGHGFYSSQFIERDNSLIPRGLGTKIMKKSMKKMKATVEWLPRVGDRGTNVKLIFPIIHN